MPGANEDPLALLPELFLTIGAGIVLLAGMFLPRQRQWVARLVAAACCLGSLAAAGGAFAGPDRLVFDGGFAVDTATNTVRVVVAAATLLVIAVSIDSVAGHARETEFYVLAMLGASGATLLAATADLLVLAIGFLLASIPLYALAGFVKDPRGTEAALKYYLLGAFFGVTMLVGITLIFGVGGSTSYAELRTTLGTASGAVVAVGLVALLAGLLFKAGGVPAHFWVPDVVSGASPPAAAFVATVPKVGALVAAYRLLVVTLPAGPVDWPLLVAVLAALSMTLGNLAAFWQTSPLRLLAYSTVSQVGYLLVAVAVGRDSGLALPALLFYLGAYAVTNLGAFAVVAELPHARTLADYRGLAARHRGLALALAVCLLGFVGTPPTAIFVGKLTVFSAAIDGGWTWLAVVAAVNTVASLFYYLRWLGPAFVRSPESAPAAPADRVDVLAPAGTWSRVGAYAAAIASLALGIGAGPALALVTGPLLS